MGERDARRREVARTIGVDREAGRLAGELAAAGTHPILLKGPVLGRLFYRDGGRTYNDIDLMVSAAERHAVESCLRRLGFTPLVTDEELQGHRLVHAHEWTGPAGVSIDLHRTLPGAAAAPAVVFDAIAEHTVPLDMSGGTFEALDVEAALVQVALHVAHHGPGAGRALADLERSVAAAAAEEWRGAAALAVRLEATPAFAHGLRLTASGAEVASRLSLPHDAPVEVRLRAEGAPPLAVGVDWWLRQPTRVKLELAARTLFPRPGALRLWRPTARRGRSGLLLAYATHPLWLARHTIPSLRAARRVRRSTR